MKFFLAFALIATVASAAVIKPTVVSGEVAEIQQIAAAISSPNTDPATAAALTEMLLELLGVEQEQTVDPVAVGAISVEAPAHDGGAVTAEEPAVINPTPAVVIGDLPAGSAAPIVQIIVKVNNPEAAVVSPVAVGAETVTPGAVNWVDGPAAPVVTPVQVTEPVVPGAVNWVEGAETPVVSPVQVAEPVVPGAVNWVDGGDSVAISPVQVAEPVVPGAVNWVDGADTVVVEPIAIGTPIIPSPVVAMPESLN